MDIIHTFCKILQYHKINAHFLICIIGNQIRAVSTRGESSFSLIASQRCGCVLRKQTASYICSCIRIGKSKTKAHFPHHHLYHLPLDENTVVGNRGSLRVP